VIGGLVSSTLLTLLVLPVLYYLVEGAAERRAQYPPLAPSIATRLLAIVGGVLVAVGAVFLVIAIAGGLPRTSIEALIGGRSIPIGILLLLAALIVWLVRSARNRRANPVAQPAPDAPLAPAPALSTAESAPGDGSDPGSLSPTVDA
jgi:hypothetical protein